MILQGDALKILQGLDAESVNCCVTSPPYFRLRDYGVKGQIGLEETPDDYISRLVEVFREVKRVLRNDGTVWVNIGDSYSGSGKGGQSEGKRSENWQPEYSNKGKCYGLKPKDLIGIPWMLAFALRSDGWYLRQDIIWQKPNPMPESVTDRCTKSHEYIFLLSKSRTYYFDAEAIAEPVTQSTIDRLSQDIENQQGSERVPGKTNGAMKAAAPRYGGKKYTENPDVFNRTKSGNAYEFRENRNKRDVWSVSTQPFKEAHFATFPKELIRPCILAGSPVNGTVIDPFFGSGTTGEVSLEENRNFIGIELNPAYIEIAKKRISNVQVKMII